MKFLLFILLAFTATAASVNVTWDPSIDTTVTSYSVRYGLSSANKTNVVNVTGTNSVALTVTDGVRLFLDVTAINSIGIKSLPSADVVFSTAIPPTPTNIRVVGQ